MIFYTLIVVFFISVILVSSSATIETECPVCIRLIKSIKSYALSQSVKNSEAFDKYCSMPSLEVEEQKFCYNTDTVKKDILRLLDLGADELRICKKIKSINADFCQVRAPKVVINPDIPVGKRGVIYI